MTTETVTTEEAEVVPTSDVGHALARDRPTRDQTAISASGMNAEVMHRLADAGYPVLIEDDVTLLRAAFAHTQKLYAAILDPRDYLYLVSYKEGNKTRQFVSKNRDHAEKIAITYGAEVSARPVKTGIVKLAVALGIEAAPTSKGWVKDEQGQHYYEVTYKAVHRRSGRTEYGVGACDRSERGGHIRTHDIITTADTRAYNRAILRLSGFGDVSADEVIAAADGDVPEYVPETPRARPMTDLPSEGSDEVLTAARTWAESIAQRAPRDRYKATARQGNLAARETRAAARRGDVEAAMTLGASGLKWDGPAQDGHGYPSFDVGPSPVQPEQVEAVKEATSQAIESAPETTAEKTAEGGDGKGWDLSSQGSVEDDKGDVATSEPGVEGVPSPIPPPDPRTETITTKQAKNISKLLLEINADDRAKCGAWLQQFAHVPKSTQVRSNQYEQIFNLLTATKEKT